MSLEDRDYLHEDRKQRIRRGQMEDIYYNPKEFRRDRQCGQASVTLPPGHGSNARPSGRGPTDYRDFQAGEAPPSRLLWFSLGVLSSFLAVMAILVIQPELLNTPYLWVERWVSLVIERLQS